MLVTNTGVTWRSADPFVSRWQVKRRSCCRRPRWKSSTTRCVTWSRRDSSPPGCSAAASWPEESMHARWERHLFYPISSMGLTVTPLLITTSLLLLLHLTREIREALWRVSRRVGSGSRRVSWAGARAALAGTSRASTRVSSSWESGSGRRRACDDGAVRSREGRRAGDYNVPKKKKIMEKEHFSPVQEESLQDLSIQQQGRSAAARTTHRND